VACVRVVETRGMKGGRQRRTSLQRRFASFRLAAEDPVELRIRQEAPLATPRATSCEAEHLKEMRQLNW
jgi:hypothetical protein